MTQTRGRNPISTLLKFLIAPAVLLSAAGVHAQLKHEGPAKLIALSQTTSPYDVVSIKETNTSPDSGNLNFYNEKLVVRSLPLENIIEFAYNVSAERVTGIPGSLKDQRFDIDAKIVPSDGSKPPDASASEDQARLILLLADRFHLKVHVQPKTMPTYDLVVAKGGPRIKLSQDELKDSTWNVSNQDASSVLTSKGAAMGDLAAALTDEVHRQVVDETGLTGHADITLKWSDDVAMQQGGPNVVSIFTAVEEQLGLKLQSSKGPVDTLVIDHAEMPTAN